jgi:hypothetical protein
MGIAIESLKRGMLKPMFLSADFAMEIARLNQLDDETFFNL